MNATQPTGRRPWAAVALSLLCTGLGQIYCGRVVKGLVLFCLSLLFAPVAVLAAAASSSTAVLLGLIAGVVAVVGLYLYSVADAFLAARSAREDYQPRDYNRGVVYVLFALVGVIYPVGVGGYLRAHVFEAFLIPSASMVPTVLDGDRVLVNKTVYRDRFPERGDVVVFRVPREPGRAWIKRVIGLPGDKVAVKGGEVYVNGKKLERDRVPASHLAALGGQADGEVFAETNAGRRYRIM